MHFTKQELEAMPEIELFARVLHAEAGNQMYMLKSEIGIVVTAMLHQLPNDVAKMKADHYYNPKLCNPQPTWAKIYPRENIEQDHDFHIEPRMMV